MFEKVWQPVVCLPTLVFEDELMQLGLRTGGKLYPLIPRHVGRVHDAAQQAESRRKIHRDNLEILFGYRRAKCNDQLIVALRQCVTDAMAVSGVQVGCKPLDARENVFGLRGFADFLEFECEKTALFHMAFVKVTLREREG